MKKNFIWGAMAVAAMSLAACNNANPKMDSKEGDTGADIPVNGSIRIAYVEVDSLMSQYNFAKDYTLIIQKKSNNARNTLQQKGQQLQNAANNFQQKLQNNGFQSREQAEQVQANLQRQQQDLQELEARLTNELAEETQKYNDALRDSLNHFLTAYNKDKKFDMILSKAGDNILYANKKFDITQDVINGLNKRYKPIAKKEDKGKK